MSIEHDPSPHLHSSGVQCRVLLGRDFTGIRVLWKSLVIPYNGTTGNVKSSQGGINLVSRAENEFTWALFCQGRKYFARFAAVRLVIPVN